MVSDLTINLDRGSLPVAAARKPSRETVTPKFPATHKDDRATSSDPRRSSQRITAPKTSCPKQGLPCWDVKRNCGQPSPHGRLTLHHTYRLSYSYRTRSRVFS